MSTKSITLESLIGDHQKFLKYNLTGNEVTEIAYKIKKSVKTVNNYIDPRKNKAVDFLTMKAICETGLEILLKRGVEKI